MNLIRYEPWSLHRELANQLNHLFDRTAEAAHSTEWTPNVDIEEYADKFVLTADVPGVDPKSIEVTLEGGTLTLTGAREQTVEAKGVEARRIERASGRFTRRFALPDTVDAENVSADGKHGVLTLTIPKRPQAQARRITVRH